MVLSRRHEEPNRDLAMLVQLVAVELDIDFHQLGSTTFKREHLQKGFEPDSAFYFARVSETEGRELDAEIDPPSGFDHRDRRDQPLPEPFSHFAAFGVPEVWRYHRSRVTFYRLEGGRYVETLSSTALSPLTAEVATRFLEERLRMRSPQWVRHVREWARQQR